MGKSRICVVDGKEYPTRVEACLAYDVSYKSVNQLIARGMTAEEAIHWLIDNNQELGTVVPEPEDTSVVVFGKEYLHVVEVAHALDIPYVTFMLLLEDFGDPEKAVTEYRNRTRKAQIDQLRRQAEGIETFLYRGTEYEKLSDVAEVMGVSLLTLEKLSGGRTLDEVGDMIDRMSSKTRKK